MANKNKRLIENTEGNFFVDSACFNCGLSRRHAPTIFGDTGSHAFVKHQPRTDEELLATKQAMLVCPTGSIGTREKVELRSALNTFPIELTDDVFLCGFNSRDSYGAESYFVRSDEGNWLIDLPRYTKHLVDQFENAGGLKYIFLTHRDDVADAHKYAAHFSAKRIIHEYELAAQPDAEIVLHGESEHQIDQAIMIFTPGHMTVHMVLLWQERYLFTGDHIAWISSIGGLGSFSRYCWHSWPEQILSVEKLAKYQDVEWVFLGHGQRTQIQSQAFADMVTTAAAWMKTQ